MQETFPNLEIIEIFREQILIDNDFSTENFATNIGFGISYALPVIVTCLIAKEKSFIVIEEM